MKNSPMPQYGWSSSGERIMVDIKEMVNGMTLYFPPASSRKAVKDSYKDFLGNKAAIIYFLRCLKYKEEEIAEFTNLGLNSRQVGDVFRHTVKRVKKLGINPLHEYRPTGFGQR